MTQSEECIYCGAEVPSEDIDTVPRADEDNQWDRIAGQHVLGCEWVETRAHQRMEEER